jgi:hypothetical protein
MELTAENSQPGTTGEVLNQAGEALDLVALRQQITSLVCARAVKMVETTIEQVQNGHYQALKYLFEMIGLYPGADVQEASQEDSLAMTLLRHLGISEEGEIGTEIGTLANPKTALPGGDAVK